MKCPICGNEMKKKTQYICVMWDQIDGDSEYRLDVTYSCKNHHLEIKYNEYDDEWEIPDEIKVTNKQLDTALFIECYTNKRKPEVPLKYEYWKFIKRYLPMAIRHKEN